MGVEITGAINLAQITGKSKDEIGKQIEGIKKKCEEDSAKLLIKLEMKADKKHKRLMDRIANLKAKEIQKIETIRHDGEKNDKTKEQIEQEIDLVRQESEKDINNVIAALANRDEKQKEKQTEKIMRAINKLADINLKEDNVAEQLENLQQHE